MGLSATTLAWIGAASGVVGAVGTVVSGMQAQQQGKTQAAILRQQADRERQQAETDSQDFRDQQSRLLAQRRAVLGGSGVDFSTGSPLLASEDFAGETELQALKIKTGGEVRGTRLEQQAMLIRQQGNDALTGSLFRGGASLLEAGSKVKWG